jgi:hypothetical protein
MEAIAIPVLLLRSAMGDMVLREGTVLGGKVLERNGAHGLLLLAGSPLVAALPDGVAAGQRLRLRVAEAGADRVVLQVLGEPGEAPAGQPASASAPASPLAAAYAAALPAGASARLLVEPDADSAAAAGGGGSRAVTLRYDSPRLGRLDLRLDAGSCAVHVAAGPPADLVAGAAGALRDALGAATGRPMQVTVHPRRRTLDVRT